MDQAGTEQPPRVAVLVADGADGIGTDRVTRALRDHGVTVELVAPAGGRVDTANAGPLEADRALPDVAAASYDAVLVPCGPDSTATLAEQPDAVSFVAETYRHGKPVAAFGTGRRVLARAGVLAEEATEADVETSADHGLVVTSLAQADVPERFTDELVAALARPADGTRAVDHHPA